MLGRESTCETCALQSDKRRRAIGRFPLRRLLARIDRSRQLQGGAFEPASQPRVGEGWGGHLNSRTSTKVGPSSGKDAQTVSDGPADVGRRIGVWEGVCAPPSEVTGWRKGRDSRCFEVVVGRSRKPVYRQRYRGFESHLLRLRVLESMSLVQRAASWTRLSAFMELPWNNGPDHRSHVASGRMVVDREVVR